MKIKSHYFFEKAEENFLKELDVVRVVKTLKKYKMLAEAMLSQKHRLLLKFQRQNLIETTSSSSDSDDNTYDELAMMESKNPMVQLMTYGKIKKMMCQFKGKKVDNLERNMMRGLFQKHLKDFTEEAIKH